MINSGLIHFHPTARLSKCFGLAGVVKIQFCFSFARLRSNIHTCSHSRKTFFQYGVYLPHIHTTGATTHLITGQLQQLEDLRSSLLQRFCEKKIYFAGTGIQTTTLRLMSYCLGITFLSGIYISPSINLPLLAATTLWDQEQSLKHQHPKPLQSF